MYSRYNTISKNVEKYLKSINLLKEKCITNGKFNIKLYKPNKNLPEIELTSPLAVRFTNNEKNENINTKFTSSDKIGLRKLLRTKLNRLNISTSHKNVLASLGVGAVYSKDLETPVLSGSILQDTIPEPPTLPSHEIVEAIVTSGEPPFTSLGLGGWSPVGIVQQCLEYLHISLDIPWWGAIAIGTCVVRIFVFPLVVIAQRNGARMNNYLPQLQVLQLKMTEARQTGNQLDAARYGQEMVAFMKEKQLNPLKNMIVPLAQMPLFISFFMGLREMANCPVASMQTGGMFWFNDLTLPDQYFALPIITSITMWLTIELGTDSAKLSSQNLQTMKYVLRALPLIILPFTVNFPGAILCYWVCTNFISLGQVGILRIPAVRDYFKIEPHIAHNTETLPIKPKGFVKGMKESWTNMKITSELDGRRRYDEMQFQRAGKGPIVKTYKYDPTKQHTEGKS